MLPVTLNGGTEITASSETLGVRSSGGVSTFESATAKRTAARLIWANSARIVSPRVPNSSDVTSPRTTNPSSAMFRMSVTRRWRVANVPRMTNASVYRISETTGGSPSPSNMAEGYADRGGTGRSFGAWRHSPGACGHQQLGPLLEALVQ